MNEQLNKYFTNELSVKEKNQLFDQINADENEKQEYARMQISVALSSMARQEGDEQWSSDKIRELQTKVSMKKKRSVFMFALRYAAVAVVAVLGTWFVFSQYAGTDDAFYTRIEVPKGQRVYMALADGTEAWLSPRTKIKVPNQFNKNERIVELDGEGYFSVTKDARRPFIVKTQKYDIKVLGTKFNVFAYSESPRFEADLVEGSVQVYNRSDEGDNVILVPNEKAYLENNRLIKTGNVFNNEEYLKNGIFSFTGVSFSEILNYLSLWYNVQFELKKATSLNHKVSGKFRQSDEVKDILKALQGVHRFNFKIKNESLIEIY